MKTIFTLFFFLIGITAYLQNSILLYTNFPESITFTDVDNKDLPKKPLWNKDKGGFLIENDNAGDTYIKTDNNATFKLSNQKQTTKIISLKKDEKIELNECFRNNLYCCEKLTEKQEKATEKIFAVSLMKKAINLKKALVFNQESYCFLSTEEINILWETDSLINKIEIIDINNLEIVYQSNDYKFNGLKSNRLNDGLKKGLIVGNSYLLNIYTKDLSVFPEKVQKHSVQFDLKPIVFENTSYYFNSLKTINIKWNSINKTTKVRLYNVKDNNEIYTKSDYNKQEFSADDFDVSLLKSGEIYALEVEDKKGNKEKYLFQPILDNHDINSLQEISQSLPE